LACLFCAHCILPHAPVKLVITNVPVILKSEHQDMVIQAGGFLLIEINGVVMLLEGLAPEVIERIKKRVAAHEKARDAIPKGMNYKETSTKFR
jgi:regulator of RNase E activity RraA